VNGLVVGAAHLPITVFSQAAESQRPGRWAGSQRSMFLDAAAAHNECLNEWSTRFWAET
jgi:hypothetical protein